MSTKPSLADLPESLKIKYTPASPEKSNELNAILVQADRKFLVLGVNEVSRKLNQLAAVIVFSNSGPIAAHLPTAAATKGVPTIALTAPSLELVAHLKVKKIACIGLLRESLTDDRLAELIIAIRGEEEYHVKLPFGDFVAAEKAIADQPKSAQKTQPTAKPNLPRLQSTKPGPKAKVPVSGVKRFFEDLD